MFSSFYKLLIGICLFIWGCQSENAVETTSKAFFTPNPQVAKAQTIKTLEIGSKAPNFRLPGTDGQFHQLSDYQSAKILVIVFTCNHCPIAQAYEDRLIAISNNYKNQAVQIIAISPNSPLALSDEACGYTDLHDDFEDMIARAKDKNFPFPYLYDGDNQSVSLQYGPTATPHAFIFNEERILQYQGRLDSLASSNNNDLQQVINNTLEGKTIEQTTTTTFGCSVKWSWENTSKKKSDDTWAEKAVSLDKIDINEVNILLKNDIYKKLRLINVWATWCGPCIVEYPELVKIQRMYGARAFEFVSISANKIKEEEEVLQFLKDKQSAIKNYIFSGDDVNTLVEAIDPNWDGTLPYSLLIAPNGSIVYAQQGLIDTYQLKQKIIEHPLMGRYLKIQ